jgi:hypothetical protein
LHRPPANDLTLGFVSFYLAIPIRMFVKTVVALFVVAVLSATATHMLSTES